MCVNETQIKVLWNTHTALSSQTQTFPTSLSDTEHTIVCNRTLFLQSQIQNVRHNPLPLVYLLYTVCQMLAFLPPSSYGMIFYGKLIARTHMEVDH